MCFIYLNTVRFGVLVSFPPVLLVIAGGAGRVGRLRWVDVHWKEFL